MLKEFDKAGFLQGLDVRTNEQLFEAMGKPAGNRKLATLRKIKGVGSAVRYVKWSKDAVHVNRTPLPQPGGPQRVHFADEGHDIVYLLAGNVMKPFLGAVLTNLRNSRTP